MTERNWQQGSARDFLRQIELTLGRLELSAVQIASVLRVLARLAAQRADKIDPRR